MDTLKLSISTILFVLVFITPGMIFNYIVTRWVFASGRYNSSKIASIISSVLVSILFVIVIDRPISRTTLSSIVDTKLIHKYITTNQTLIENIKLKKVLESSLDKFDDGPKKDLYPIIVVTNNSQPKIEVSQNLEKPKSSIDRQETFFLIFIGATLIILSAFSAILFSLVIISLENFIENAYIIDFLILTAYQFQFLSKLKRKFFPKNKKSESSVISKTIDQIKVASQPLLKFQIINRLVNVFVNIAKFSYAIIKPLLLIVFAVIGISAFLAVVLLVTVIHFTTISIFFFINKVFTLFRHHFHEEFFKYQLNFCIPIVEMRTKDNYLLKGVLKSFSPLNQQELYTITISNVIQYHSGNKEQESKDLSRKSRLMYEFENQASNLTIPVSNLIDFNVWYLSTASSDDSWKFSVNTHQDINNQIWYFKLLLKHNRLKFNVKDLNVEVNYKLTYIFISKLVDEVIKQYSKGTWDIFKKIAMREKQDEILLYLSKFIRKTSWKITLLAGFSLPVQLR